MAKRRRRKTDKTEVDGEAFEKVAAWCAEYFRRHGQEAVGHSFVSLLDLFRRSAALPNDVSEALRSVQETALNEQIEAHLQRFVRGDLAGASHASIPEPSRRAAVEYMAHLGFRGDTDWVRQPEECGTVGQMRPLQGFAVRIAQADEPLWLRYRAHLAEIGDTRWFPEGHFCGTRGQWRRVEAIWVELVQGREEFDVYYSAHLARFGWTGWFKNGQMCGTRGEYRQVEAIRIFIADRQPQASSGDDAAVTSEAADSP